jgi:hypothetical protein
MKEEEIRPNSVFQEYLRLAELDAATYFGDKDRLSVNCPACLSRGQFIFRKHGFEYEECPDCNTIFVSPRPPLESFTRYYRESPSAIFFATTFTHITAEARRVKLWRAKAASINEFLIKNNAGLHSVIDVGGGSGIFAEEYQCSFDRPVTVIEPNPESAQLSREKGLNVIESFLEQVKPNSLPTGPRAFISFELFEHLHDAQVFLSHLCGLIRPNDLFLFSTLSSLGADIQALWQDSNSISLQHLNFFNPKSIKLLLARSGLNTILVETPGKLDLDILYNNRLKIKDRFWRNLISSTTDADRQIWQEFIAKRGFSSHMFVACELPS